MTTVCPSDFDQIADAIDETYPFGVETISSDRAVVDRIQLQCRELRAWDVMYLLRCVQAVRADRDAEYTITGQFEKKGR